MVFPDSSATVYIHHTSFRGLGIGSWHDKGITVPGTVTGELVNVRIIGGPRGRLFGAIERVMEPSPERIPHFCAQGGYCPGCRYGFLPYEAGLGRKVEAVRQTLSRHLSLNHFQLAAPARHPYPLGSRIRTSASIMHGVKDVVIGMPPWPGHETPVDLAKCPLHHESLNKVLSSLQTALGSGSLKRGIRLKVKAGLACSRLIELDCATAEERALLNSEVAALGPDLPEATWITTVNGKCSQVVYGDGQYFFVSAAHRLASAPNNWTPVSLASAELQLSESLNLLHANQEDAIIELGSGVGSLSLLLSLCGTRTIAVDQQRSAVEMLRANSRRLGCQTLDIREGRGDRALLRLLKQGVKAKTAILHAMRKPFGNLIARYLPALGVDQVIYCAPTPMGLIADMKDLLAVGYRLNLLKPVDQLPFTYHVMLIAEFLRDC